MNATLPTHPPLQTQNLQPYEHLLMVLQRVEKFESVARPAGRDLGASIVDEFAHDLRQLADA
jgi:hypothetical protein